MKRVIVTGAEGFLGHQLCLSLRKQNIDVVAVVRKEEKAAIFDGTGIETVCCDMKNYDILPTLLKSTGYDCLYHFAWEGSSGPLRGDYNVQCSNVVSSCKIVEVCKTIECKKIVFAASVMEYELFKAYKNAKSIPLSHLYSAGKISADFMLKIICNNYNVEYNAAIISNIYGPGEKSYRLVNTTIKKLINNEETSFSSGEQLYDFIYIDDAMKMFIAVGEKGISGKEYYIGNRKPRKLLSFLEEIRDVVSPGTELGIGKMKSPETSLDYTEFDMEVLWKDTGVEATTPFKEGIKNTLEWIERENHG